ncbi:hypothetical protein BMW24_013855 [Mycobacterium heckeshornense]|nr:hypothetical protein BMW24_013855 [Mycobacterium heckeshornense]
MRFRFTVVDGYPVLDQTELREQIPWVRSSGSIHPCQPVLKPKLVDQRMRATGVPVCCVMEKNPQPNGEPLGLAQVW